MHDRDTVVELVKRTRAGAREAYGELVILLAPDLLRLVAGLANLSEPEREDIVQEAFLRAYERLGDLREDGSYRAWVVSFARNIVSESLAKRRKQADLQKRLIDVVAVEEQMKYAEEGPAPAAERKLDALRGCVQSLPEKMRSVLKLHYEDGQELAQIASSFASPLGTVKSWLHRARTQLRKCIDAKLLRLGEAVE